MTKILIAYASAKGSTRGVAGRIAERCGAAGFDVTMFPAVESPGHEWFDAVILGSAIHDMDWLPSATVVVDRRRVAVKTQPVWAFSVATWGETSTFLSTRLTRRIRKSATEPKDGDKTSQIRGLALSSYLECNSFQVWDQVTELTGAA